MGEEGHQWGNIVGLQFLSEVTEEVFSHSGEGDWCDRIRSDVEACTFDGENSGETDESHLCGAVVCLAEVTEDSCGR